MALDVGVVLSLLAIAVAGGIATIYALFRAQRTHNAYLRDCIGVVPTHWTDDMINRWAKAKGIHRVETRKGTTTAFVEERIKRDE